MKLLEWYKINLIVDSRDRYRRAVLSLLERNEQADLLDLGSGDYRRLTLAAAKKTLAKSITCVDLDDIGRPTGESLIHYKEDLNNPLSLEKEYDIIIASHIIEHLWNTDGFIKEMYRVLKPGGYAIISTPNLASWHNLVYLLLGKQPDVATISDELYPWKEKPGHQRIFTATELVRLLEFHGFTIERVVGTSYYPLMGPLANWLARTDWKHAGNITIKVRKPREVDVTGLVETAAAIYTGVNLIPTIIGKVR